MQRAVCPARGIGLPFPMALPAPDARLGAVSYGRACREPFGAPFHRAVDQSWHVRPPRVRRMCGPPSVGLLGPDTTMECPMSTAVQIYEFEEQAVRVVMIAGDPWFVASDLAKALGYREARDMTRGLHEDERGVHIVDTPGGPQEMNIISESGMYAAIFKSRREEAERFRKWVTGTVLPSIRKTGRFEFDGFTPPPLAPADLDPIRLNASVAAVREARRLFGPAAARSIWTQVGLPAPIVDARPMIEGDNFAEPLKEWLADRSETTALWAARGLGIDDIDRGTLHRIGALLRTFGWVDWPVKREGVKVNLWFHPDHVPAHVRSARQVRGL